MNCMKILRNQYARHTVRKPLFIVNKKSAKRKAEGLFLHQLIDLAALACTLLRYVMLHSQKLLHYKIGLWTAFVQALKHLCHWHIRYASD